MTNRLIVLVAGTAIAATAAPALSEPPAHAPAWGHRAQHGDVTPVLYQRGHRDYRGYRGRVWQDDDGRYRCRKDDGTVGLLVGGALGALIGREIDGGRDRTVGTIIGAGAGALIGREIDRDDVECR